MIKNIIFDIGNVLAEFAWEAHFQTFGFEKEVFDKVVNATVKNEAWNEFDRGVWSDEEVLAAFMQREPSVETQIRMLYEKMHGLIRRCDYAIPWITALKAKGYHVYYLSNFFSKAERECADALDFIPYMDGGILSYQEKLIKPDAAIYQLLIKRYALKAEECIFLDDKAVNCEAAKKLGMSVICFQNQKQAIAELEKAGVFL